MAIWAIFMWHWDKANPQTEGVVIPFNFFSLQLKFSREYLSMSRCKVSFVADNLMDYTDTFLEFDPMLCVPGPSNPWITDDQTHWLLNQPM